MFKNMRLVILFDLLLNPSFKMTISFTNIARITASTSTFIYQERFQIIGNRVFKNWIFKNYFSYKGPIPNDLKSFLVYKFTCARCSSNYIGETCRHFKNRIGEQIKKDNKSHIFKHLHFTPTCFDSYNSFCFKIIDKTNSKFDLKVKGPLHIKWRKPNLNAQKSHLALTLLLQLRFPLLLSVFVCFYFVVFCNCLSSIVFIISKVIIGSFYCLNYALLLLKDKKFYVR